MSASRSSFIGLLGLAAALTLAAPAAAQSASGALATSVASGKVLRRGHRGSDVRELQQRLNELGASLGVDGVFGWGTEAAVRAFQQREGLTSDGLVGRNTLAAMRGAGANAPAPAPAPTTGGATGGSSVGARGVLAGEEGGEVSRGDEVTTARSAGTLRRGSNGPAVSALQRLLKDEGYSLSETGVFDSATDAALREYQRDRGLTVDGIAGPQTFGALGNDAPVVAAPAPGGWTPVSPPATGGSALVVRKRLSTGQLYVPARYAPSSEVDIMIHFHGAASVVEREYETAGIQAALVNVTFNGFSSVYTRPFSNHALLGTILDEAVRELGRARGQSGLRLGKVLLCSFSAGYGAVRQILLSGRYDDVVTDIVLLDSLHSSYDGARRPLASQMAPFVSFAREAARGMGTRLVVSHSSIVPGSYASTTETAGALIDAVGAAKTPRPGETSLGMRRAYTASLGGFIVHGFEGRVANDHSEHLRNMGQFLSETSFATR